MGTEGRVGMDTVEAPDALDAVAVRLAALAAAAVAVAADLADVLRARCAPDADAPLDAAGVARELGVSRKQAQNLIGARAFPVEHLGRYLRVRKGDVLAYRAAHREPARGGDLGVAVGYKPRHDKHRPPAPPAPAGDDPAKPRGRPRRAHDDRVALGDRREPDPPPRRRRAHALRGARAGDPLDVGAADALPQEG
jgi:hypothetical protein